MLAVTPRFLDALVQRWGSGDGATVRLYEAGVRDRRRARRRAPRSRVARRCSAGRRAPLALFALRPFSKYFDIRFLISSLPVFFLLAGAGVDAIGARRGAARGAHFAIGTRWPQRRGDRVVAAAAAVVFLVPAAQLYQRFRVLDRGCGDFVNEPALFAAHDRLCADHLLLNTAAAEQQWIVRSLRPEFALRARAARRLSSAASSSPTARRST